MRRRNCLGTEIHALTREAEVNPHRRAESTLKVAAVLLPIALVAGIVIKVMGWGN